MSSIVKISKRTFTKKGIQAWVAQHIWGEFPQAGGMPRLISATVTFKRKGAKQVLVLTDYVASKQRRSNKDIVAETTEFVGSDLLECFDLLLQMKFGSHLEVIDKEPQI